MPTRPSAASPAQRPHFATRPGMAGATARPSHRRAAVKGLAVFAVLIVPAAVGVGLASREGDWGTWAVMVGLPIAAAACGYWLGRASRSRDGVGDDGLA